MVLAERVRARSPIAIENVTCVAGAKRGGGGGGGGGIEKRKRERSPLTPPNPPPLFPFFPIPYPFRRLLPRL